MDIRSKKSKGRRAVTDSIKLISMVLKVNKEDMLVTPSSCPGRDISLDSSIRYRFPYAIEVKNWEKISLVLWWKQVCQYITEEYTKPLVIFTGNRQSLWCLRAVEEIPNDSQEITPTRLTWNNIERGKKYYFKYKGSSILLVEELRFFLENESRHQIRKG